MESFVTQETHLFHDSIKNNIRIAKLDASDEEIRQACRKASIHDFIMTLPEGYDTPVREREGKTIVLVSHRESTMWITDSAIEVAQRRVS